MLVPIFKYLVIDNREYFKLGEKCSIKSANIAQHTSVFYNYNITLKL